MLPTTSALRFFDRLFIPTSIRLFVTLLIFWRKKAFPGWLFLLICEKYFLAARIPSWYRERQAPERLFAGKLLHFSNQRNHATKLQFAPSPITRNFSSFITLHLGFPKWGMRVVLLKGYNLLEPISSVKVVIVVKVVKSPFFRILLMNSHPLPWQQ